LDQRCCAVGEKSSSASLSLCRALLDSSLTFCPVSICFSLCSTSSSCGRAIANAPLDANPPMNVHPTNNMARCLVTQRSPLRMDISDGECYRGGHLRRLENG